MTTALTQDSKQAVVGEEAWRCHRRIVDKRNEAEQTFLELAEALYIFKRRRFFVQMGHPTFESYIADPEVDISRSLAYRLIQEHELFVLDLECPPDRLLEAGNSKLSLIAPHVDDGNADELVEMATVLSRSDLRVELKEMFGDDAVPTLPTDYRRWARAWKRLARYYRRRLNGGPPRRQGHV